MPVPSSHVDILDKTAFASIATIGPNGEPQNNPIWFGWIGSQNRFLQTTTRQKYRNMRADGRVALSILDPDDPYRYIEVRGVTQATNASSSSWSRHAPARWDEL